MTDSRPAPQGGGLARQARWLDRYKLGLRIREQGTVVSVGDGIAWIDGLPSAAVDDILVFDDGSHGTVFDLTPGLIGAVLLHDTDALTAGTKVQRLGRVLSIPAGDDLLGRVVDPLGAPMDGDKPPTHTRWMPLETSSPPVLSRDFVTQPLYSGIRMVDTMIPIGKGQRQLLIGDQGLGRSSVALDTVVNQRGKDVYCVYVLIGQRRSTVVNTIETLLEYQALSYTAVVVAEASSLPGLQYLAPFAGCALAEFWMRQGKDVLVVYDDLSTHAKTYRELSLLLHRPPGREAYPGDIFSVHARLLERATCLNSANGGGTMTTLPIVETELGEIAAYIPTNLISITDGQIYLDRSLFSGGFRPAIDIARSVSRVGGRAQHPRIKQEAGRMKLDYLQFQELEVFTRFGARLETSMEAALKRGHQLREILKQERFSPSSERLQMAWLVAFNDGCFDAVGPGAIPALLATLEQSVRNASIDLEAPRSEWSAAVRQWMDSASQVLEHGP